MDFVERIDELIDLVPVMMIMMIGPVDSMRAMDLSAIVFHRLAVLPLRVS